MLFYGPLTYLIDVPLPIPGRFNGWLFVVVHGTGCCCGMEDSWDGLEPDSLPVLPPEVGVQVPGYEGQGAVLGVEGVVRELSGALDLDREGP